MSLKKEKRKLREKIWKLLKEKRVVKFPLPIEGRIPNFEGGEISAKLLKSLPEWKRAKIVLSNPDSAQRPVRELVLKEGKILILATPKLKKGYLKIDPQKVKGKEKEASTIKGAFKYGKFLKKLIKPDLIITGCVAVDKKGNRLGKGGGYGDREIKTFKEKFGKILVLTTVHDLQIVGKVPSEIYDQKVDIIITPTRIIKCQKN